MKGQAFACLSSYFAKDQRKFITKIAHAEPVKMHLRRGAMVGSILTFVEVDQVTWWRGVDHLIVPPRSTPGRMMISTSRAA